MPAFASDKEATEELRSSVSKYYLPPEWAAQDGVMLTWPHRSMIWEATIEEINKVFVEVTKHIAQEEKVLITCYDAIHAQQINKLLQQAQVNLSNVNLFLAAADDIWVRDHGPIAVFDNEEPLLLDFTFNGWGNKYPATQDNLISRTIHMQNAFGNTPLRSIDRVLEGGAIEVDGHGTLLTTRSCLLAKTRNPQLSVEKITQELQQFFGLNRILWIDTGFLAGDDTDGHIDTLARFVDPHTICYIQCNDSRDKNFVAMQALEKQLQNFKDFEGRPYKLIPLPWPQTRFADYDGRQLPLTYANFLIINNAVLVPTYQDPADQEALDVIADCFPQRKIIGIDCSAVIQWYGSLHCMTMQLPKGVLT